MKKRAPRIAITATAVMVIAAIFPTVSPSIARADDTTTPAEATAVADQVAADNLNGTNGTPDPVPVNPASPIAIHASLPDATINVPSDPSQPTMAKTDTGATIGLTDPSASSAAPVAEGGPGVAVSDANNGSMVATVITHTGLSNDIVINSAGAPTSYSTRITLSPGQSIQSTTDGGYQVVNSTGDVSAVIGAPWATDATGAAVPTHYELSGDVLTQVVDFHQDGVVLPVTADPFWSFLGHYLACITGVGVPIGVAIEFVLYVGLDALYVMAVKGVTNYRPGGPPSVGALVRPYVKVVYNNCRQYFQS